MNKKLLVNAIALASVAFTLTACSGEGITSTNETTTESTSTQNTQTSGEFNHVNAPVGTVFGLVKDTNGNPVAGATVSFGDTSVTTTASGQYTLPNIAVVQSVFDDECGCSVNALALTITPPAGYLGATVTVKPKSQAITTGNNGEAPQILFLDGFSVSAGVAHLPALVATASGTLRDDDTGVPLAGVSLSLDLTSVDNNNTSATDEDHDNVGTTHTAPQFTVVTDADGKFSFTGLPADSRLSIFSDMYDIVSNGTINTEEEWLDEYLGSVTASMKSNEDTISPYVTSVGGIIVDAATGVLDDDKVVTGADVVLNIKFSENIETAAIDANSVRVVNRGMSDTLDTDNSHIASSDLTVALVDNMLTLTIAGSATNALVEGNFFDVYLLKADFRDLADMPNNLTTNSSLTVVKYDSDYGNNSEYVRLSLKAFIEMNDSAQAVTPMQQFTSESSEAWLVQDSSMLSDNFIDVSSSESGLQNLNTADRDDHSAGSRILALADTYAGAMGVAGFGSANPDFARVTISLMSGATDIRSPKYLIELTDADGVNIWDNGNRVATEEGVTTHVTVNDYTIYKPQASVDEIAIELSDVQVGDVLTVTPYDEFDVPGTAMSVTLTDELPPIPVIQNSYNVAGDDESGVYVPTYGNGGEQSIGLEATAGSPYLHIAPRLLINVDGTNSAPDGDFTTLHDLYDFNTKNTSAATTPIVIGSTNPNEAFLSANNTYDATAFTAFKDSTTGKVTRKVGIAWSENLATVGTPTFAGTAALSDWMVQNDVTVEDDGGNTSADLTIMTVDNVLTLANTDHNQVIDFEGSVVTGSDGNSPAVGDNAKVIVSDKMPPFVTSSTYDGEQFVIVFNEKVELDDTSEVVIGGGLTFDLDPARALLGEYTLSADGLTVTIKRAHTAWNDSAIDHAGLFTLGAYDEANSDEEPQAGEFNHYSIDFSAVEDANGNKWDDEATVTAPMFAGNDTTKPIDSTVTSFAYNNTDNEFTIVYTFSNHDVNIFAWDTNNDDAVEDNELNGLFTYNASTGAETVDYTNASMTVGATGRVVTVRFEVSADPTATENVSVNWTAAFQSAYDSNQTETPAATSNLVAVQP